MWSLVDSTAARLRPVLTGPGLPTKTLVTALVATLLPLQDAFAVTPAQPDTTPSAHDICLLGALNDASGKTSVEQIRTWCDGSSPKNEPKEKHGASEQALRARLVLEESTQYNPFVITPHYRNYVLPYSYWDNPKWNDSGRNNDSLDNHEAKFQVSIKMPLLNDFWDGSTFYGAFTTVSFWQVYNAEISKPFRETNYQPELFVAKPISFAIGPIKSELFSFGYMHQSNGRDIPLSRSWDRLFVSYVFRAGSYYYSIRPWWRVPEDSKDGPTDRRGDDNPDIEKYLGHFEFHMARPFGNHVAEIMLRNNLRTDNKGAVMVDYSFPLSKRFKGLVQAFTGYGDSLINYDDYETRYSIGILLTDSL